MWHEKSEFSILNLGWGAKITCVSEFAVGEKEKAGLMFFRTVEGSPRNVIKSSVL